MPVPLDGVRLKIARANTHAQELERKIAEWSERRPYGHTGQFEPDSSTYVFRHRIYEPPPNEWSIIIGDVLHNLASALEHLAWQLVIYNGRTPIEHQTSFPIISEKSVWESRKRGGGAWITEGMSEFHKLALRWYQPYWSNDPPKHPLTRLRQLWNFDKHRTLTPVLGQYAPGVTVRAIAVHDVESGTFTGGSVHPIGPIEDDAEFARLPVQASGPDPTVHLAGHVPVDILFGEGTGPVGERIDETLGTIYRYVDGIFQELARSMR